jgi:HTH-type transcriptional regulator, transcriptional repressor of NAD biosynthesis genes
VTAQHSARFRLGLVVGKFSPLHRGHEHLIEVALAACEQVLVLGYSQPELPGCGRNQRETWVARRCPGVINLQIDDAWVQQRCAERELDWRTIPPNESDDDTHQMWLAWLLDGPLGLRPDAMFAGEAYLSATCRILSQRFGHAVVPVSVDPERTRFPIRASAIRSNVCLQHAAMHPDVYQDYVLKTSTKPSSPR